MLFYKILANHDDYSGIVLIGKIILINLGQGLIFIYAKKQV